MNLLPRPRTLEVLPGQFNLGAADSSGFSGFFAQAYNFAGGKVLAYRGTDDIGDAVPDILAGVGVNGPLPQNTYAAQFYQAVAHGAASSPLKGEESAYHFPYRAKANVE